MSETSAGATAASSGDDKSNSMWHLLPTFDPAIDDAREYAQKVRFLHGVLPQKDKGQLAPRLAMLCRGTAWNQVRTIPPEKLVDPTNGVKVFLQSLSTWEESEEMVTFEKFERAMYKILQKSDESTMSFVNRLGVAFAEIGDSVTVKDFHAFILLRQSNLSPDDKKKVLTMTGGRMEIKAIDQAMRSLATRVLSGPGDVKKKVYPVNFTEEENSDVFEGGETAWNVSHDDEDDWDNLDSLIQQGDADALTIQTFEQDLEDLFQSTPDLQSALLTYQEARQKLTERKKFRGFWPTRNFGGKGKGKGKKGHSKSFSGFGKSSLLDRIAKTHCKLCGEKGHWKAECPNKTKENVNIAVSSQVVDPSMAESFTTYAPDLLVEETRQQSFCFDQALCSFVCYAPQELNRDKSWKSSAISFLSQRIEQRKHSKNEVAPSSTLPYISDDPLLKDRSTAFHVTTDGSYAVLDTGASRSVIGSELVPSLLKDLSAEVRARVKEVPSHVGFRFGNNQVLYSKSQLQVPLCHSGSKKIWLLVEVVKGLTPFLLSIHAMKRLGAQIDLESSQVYLRNLKRSIVIHENKNGLMSIRLQDLCDEKFVKGQNNEQLICASQHLASSDLIEPSSDPCIDKSQHAEPSRDDPKYQDSCRASHGQFEGVASVTGQSCRNSCNTSASARREGDSPQAVDVGGTATEASNRGNLSTAPSSGKSSTICGTINGSHRFGPGMGADVKCRFSDAEHESSVKVSSDDSLSGANCDTTDVTHECCTSHSIHSRESSGASNSSEQSRGDKSSESNYTRGDRCNSTQSGIVGTKVHQLGQEVDRGSLSRSVRTGSGLRRLDCCPGQHVDTSNEGLLHVLPEPGEDGARALETEASHLVQQDFVQLLLASFVTSPWEEKMLKDSLIGIVPKEPIDLLEVYAGDTSRLTKVVQDFGGKSLRFTKADGDLSTTEGQIKLLRLVFEHSPKHLWLAPECLPWCAWNRFNQMRSLQQWVRVNDLQEESRIHLKFCNLLMKVQRENNRHCHLENPDGSGLWNQPEISESLRCTMPARFDQCQMGLKHPQNRKLIKREPSLVQLLRNFMRLWMIDFAMASMCILQLPDRASLQGRMCLRPVSQPSIRRDSQNALPSVC